MLKIKQNINNFNDKIVIPLNLSSMFNTELNKGDELNKKFADFESSKKINPIVDMEKVRVEPITKILDDFQSTFLSSITFNLIFLNKRTKNWYTKQQSNYELIGFNNDDIKYQRTRLKRSALILSFYDSKNQTNQNLLYYTTIYVDTIDLYKNYVKSIINNDLDPIKSLLVNFKSFDPIKNNTRKLTEGFYLYLFKDLFNNLSSKIYMKAEFINASTGEKIVLMNPKIIKQPDFINGQSYTITEFYNNLYTEITIYYSQVHNKFLYYYGEEKTSTSQTDKDLIIDLYQANVR